VKLACAVASPETRDPDMLALRGEPAALFAELRRHGYAGVDLMARDPDRIDARALAAAARAEGLGFAAVSTGQVRKEDGLSLAHADPGVRARAVDRGRAIVDLAAALRAPQVNVGTFRGELPGGPERAAALGAATEGFVSLLRHASASGVRLAVEPQSRGVSSWLNTVDEALRLSDGLPAPGLALVFDVYHARLEEPSLSAALVRAAPRLGLVQISGTDRRPPDREATDCAEVIRTLRALGYAGFVALEARLGPTPGAALAEAARVLLPWLDESADDA
jgi:D-psicose/D-tagatose/L-ribulose 3-epimerase